MSVNEDQVIKALEVLGEYEDEKEENNRWSRLAAYVYDANPSNPVTDMEEKVQFLYDNGLDNEFGTGLVLAND